MSGGCLFPLPIDDKELLEFLGAMLDIFLSLKFLSSLLNLKKHPNPTMQN